MMVSKCAPGARPRLRVAALAPLLLALVAVAACRSETIYNVHGVAFPHTATKDEQVADLIRTAGERQGWKIESTGPGTMRGVYQRGRHRAEVAITYTADSYNIDYQDSDYLKYDGTSVHRIYNKWVRQLAAAIDREAQFELR